MSGIDPVIRNAPNARNAARRRLSELSPTLSGVSPAVSSSFQRVQAERADRGQWPYTRDESALAIQAAETGQAQVNAPKKGIGPLDLFGNALDDLRDITDVAPSMLIPSPNNPLIKEVMSLGSLGKNANEAVSSASNPLQAVGNLAMTPGLRMAPMSYVAGGLFEGTDPVTGEKMTRGDLLRHPLFTGLDVLPVASKGAKATRAATASNAERAALQTARRTAPEWMAGRADGFRNFTARADDALDVAPSALRAPRATPFRDVLLRKAISPTETVPTRLGTVVDQASRQTQLGKLSGRASAELSKLGYGGMRGKNVRGITRMKEMLEGEIKAVMETGDPALIRKLMAEEADLPPAQQVTNLIEAQRAFEAKYVDTLADETLKEAFETGRWSHLPDGMVDEYRALQLDVARRLEATTGKIRVDAGNRFVNPEFRSRFADEVIDVADEKRLLRIDAKWSNANAKVTTIEREFAHAVKGITEEASTSRALYDMLVEAKKMGDFDPTLMTARALTAAQDYIRLFDKLSKPGGIASKTKTIADLARARSALSSSAYSEMSKLANKPIAKATRTATSVSKNLAPARRSLSSANRAVLRSGNRVVPARFIPAVREDLLNRLKDHLEGQRRAGMDPALIDESLAKVAEGEYANLPSLDQKDMSRFMREATASWYEMKSNPDLDPVFVHHAPPLSEKGQAMLRPQVGATIFTPSQVKKRTWDISPSENSVHLALKHQEMEWLTDAANREFVDTIDTAFAKPHTQLIDEWTDVYKRAGDPTPHKSAREAVERTTKVFDPAAFVSKRRVQNVPSGAGGLKESTPRPVMRIDKSLAEAMEAMHSPAGLSAIFDPFMKVFRTAILPLSLRWHIYNIFGGAGVVAAENPRALLRLGEAYKATGSLGEALKQGWKQEDGLRPGFGEGRTAPRNAPPQGGGGFTVPEERIFATPEGSPSAASVLNAHKHVTGSAYARMWDQVQKSGAGSMSKKFGRFVSASHAGNAWFDDLYRAATSIQAFDDAVKKGASSTLAEEAAGEAVRTVMQSWDEMTAAERTIMRSVFPFYGFARFAVGFVMRYPFDHPLRTAVIAQFARNEVDDLGSAFGKDLLSMFPIGGMDDNGDQLMMRTSGMNPFRDVVDWFTLSGFVGQTNPVISATLQSLGVEPRTGGPMLYPNLRYDPQTGGMVADTPSWIPGVITSTIPQARFLQNVLGMNQEFAAMASRDPDAAGRMLIGQIGLPAIPEQVNMPEEAFGAEINRYRALKDAAAKALETGDLGLMDDWMDMPEVRTYVETLRELDEAGELDQYRTAPAAPGLVETGVRGILPQGSS